jgi:putative transposase
LFNSPRVHFMRNPLAHAGKSGRRVVSAFIATAFAQDDAGAAQAQGRHVADQVRSKLPKLAAVLDEAEEDVLADMTFPREHRAKIHSTDEIDEIDKRFVAAGAMILAHGRPRGEERGGGWEPRRAA